MQPRCIKINAGESPCFLVHNSETHTGVRIATRYKTKLFLIKKGLPLSITLTWLSKVYNIFKMMGYNLHVSHLLTLLCTCKEVLPQGGVTSPTISNIVCIRLDRRIAGYVGKHNVTYTRYADDLTFSSLSFVRLLRIRKFIERILREEGFNLNKGKTRFMGKRTRREVTGLVLGENSVGIGKQKKRILRVKIFQLLRNKVKEEDKPQQINHINGWLSFLAHIDKGGVRMLERYACSLNKKHGLRFPA